jgi:hypothetical protein
MAILGVLITDNGREGGGLYVRAVAWVSTIRRNLGGEKLGVFFFLVSNSRVTVLDERQIREPPSLVALLLDLHLSGPDKCPIHCDFLVSPPPRCRFKVIRCTPRSSHVAVERSGKPANGQPPWLSVISRHILLVHGTAGPLPSSHHVREGRERGAVLLRRFYDCLERLARRTALLVDPQLDHIRAVSGL